MLITAVRAGQGRQSWAKVGGWGGGGYLQRIVVWLAKQWRPVRAAADWEACKRVTGAKAQPPSPADMN